MTDDARTDVDAFIAWAADSGGAERANAQTFLTRLADVLGVPGPDLTTGDPARDAYVFERPIVFQDGTQGRSFIDLYKRSTFVLETKQGADETRVHGQGRRRLIRRRAPADVADVLDTLAALGLVRANGLTFTVSLVGRC